MQDLNSFKEGNELEEDNKPREDNNQKPNIREGKSDGEIGGSEEGRGEVEENQKPVLR